MKQPVIDMSSCVLCGICTELAPDVFYFNDLGFIEVLPLPDYSDPAIHDAMINCPKDCILFE
jgi:ferredoxin